MAFDFNFKDDEARNQTHQRHNHIDSGSESAFIGSWGSSSSSSFLTTSFGSELDSNDADLEDDEAGEEDHFIAQLTRQMADYMLEEDENPLPKLQKRNLQEIHNQNHEPKRSYADTVKKSMAGFQSEKSNPVDKQTESPIQVRITQSISGQTQGLSNCLPFGGRTRLYQVENQPRVGGGQSGGSGGGWGRKGKMAESTQQLKPHQMLNNNRGLMNVGKANYSGAVVHGSSGMRAIFLGGSGSRSMTGGTGVFLPRSATDATDQSRKKPGCSSVLVPTRVLQALEQHFNNMESLSPSKTVAQAHPVPQVKMDGKQAQESVSVDHQKSKLPQEWIY
ncbi:hypothetical protein OSB04_020993 [Centaurea solstitialis]|uniref:Uncharacterized protein n=1 Tax=Centaurea solstitialis TaxID=347529 RepID=A0AA38WDT9_9ASTR|nr:hypothetical protein OSB04_020993 [Centaurea solstitialis]